MTLLGLLFLPEMPSLAAAAASSSVLSDVILPLALGFLGSSVILGIIQLKVNTPNRRAERDGVVVDTANDVVAILREELKAERERRATVTQELSDRVAVLEARLQSADERAERYATLLLQARTELGEKSAELAQAHRDLAALGDHRRRSSFGDPGNSDEPEDA